MIKCWVRYLACLALAACFYIVYDGYFSYFIFSFVLILPFFSLLLGLSGFGIAVSLQAGAKLVYSGDTAVLILSFRRRIPFPVFGLRVLLECRNLFSGEISRFPSFLQLPFGAHTAEYQIHTQICGKLACRARFSFGDPLGLFRFSRRKPLLSEILVLPREPDSAEETEWEPNAAASTPAGIGGNSTDEIRPYYPGDSLRRVHWKLSAKLGELLVRSGGSQGTGALLLFDLWGPAEQLDAGLARLSLLARMLIEMEIPVTIGYLWDGAPHVVPWDGAAEASVIWEELLSRVPPAEGISMPEAIQAGMNFPAASQTFYLSGGQIPGLDSVMGQEGVL